MIFPSPPAARCTVPQHYVCRSQNQGPPQLHAWRKRRVRHGGHRLRGVQHSSDAPLDQRESVRQQRRGTWMQPVGGPSSWSSATSTHTLNRCSWTSLFYFFWHDQYILTWQKNHHDHHDPDFQPKTLELHKLTPYMGGVPYPINVFVMIFYFFLAW